MSYFDDNEDELIFGNQWGFRRKNVECNRCGKGGLHWEELETWVLYDSRQQKHVCTPQTAADFEDLT